MISNNQVLVVGCPTCSSNKGKIYFYDARNFDLIYEMEGDNDHKKVGQMIEYRPNSGYSEQFWYTSTKSDKTTINSILFFKKSSSTGWEYEQDEDLVVIEVESNDYFDFTHIDESVLFVNGEKMSTFVACDYNFKYNNDDTRDDEDDDDYDEMNYWHTLAYRNCTQCPDDMPFSYGFQDDECHACSEFAE